MINLLFETPKIIRRYSFHVFSMLLIIAFLTWLPLPAFKAAFPDSFLNTCSPINWITRNENLLLHLYVLFCCMESCALVLEIIALILNGCHFYQIRNLFTGLNILGAWSTLLIFIFHNLGIFQVSIEDLFLSFTEPLNIFWLIFFGISFCLNLSMSGLFALGYIRPEQDTADTYRTFLKKYLALDTEHKKLVQSLVDELSNKEDQND